MSGSSWAMSASSKVLLHQDDVGLRVQEGETALQTLYAFPGDLAQPPIVIIGQFLHLALHCQVLVHLAQHLVGLNP